MRDFEDYCWRNVIDDEVRHIYSPYVRDRGAGKRPALVVVHPGTPVRGPWLESAARLVSAFRAAHRPVIHSVPPGAPQALPAGSDAICARPVESAFFSTDLERLLTRAGAGSLVLCGAPTSGALRATAVEGKSFGYRVVVAEDAVGDVTALLHKMSLFDVAHKYADVMTIDELLDQPTLRHPDSRESPTG